MRIRIINAAEMTNYHVELGQLSGELVATDGQPCHPKREKSVWVGVAQRMDVVVKVPTAPGTLFLLKNSVPSMHLMALAPFASASSVPGRRSISDQGGGRGARHGRACAAERACLGCGWAFSHPSKGGVQSSAIDCSRDDAQQSESGFTRDL